MRSPWIPCAIIACFLLAFATFISLTQRSSRDERSPEAVERATAREGRDLVEAIYRYRNQYDLWPLGLEDVAPEFINPEQFADWRYKWFPNGRWTLTNFRAYPVSAVLYEHAETGEGMWKVTWGEGDAPLDVTQPIPKRQVTDELESAQRHAKELLRRIQANPKHMIHYQGLIWWLFERQSLAEGREVCEKCLESCPDRWWPMLMRNLIDSRMGDADGAQRQFQHWVEKEPDFNRYVFLAYLCLQSGHVDRACDALTKASELPLKDVRVKLDSREVGDENRSGQGIAFFAATIAYTNKHFTLAHRICDRWEKSWIEKSGNPDDPSFYFLRGACYLAEGRVEAAKAQVEQAKAENSKGKIWAWKALEQLERAVLKKNTTYTYDPNKESPEGLFRVKVEYQ